MKWLLETNVVSDFVRGDSNVAARLKATPPDDVAVSTITLMEVEYGLKLNPSRARRLAPVIADLFASVRVLAFRRRDARAAAAIRAELRARGKPIGPYDVLLAGSALSRGLTLVTANATEFKRVAGLSTENWREAPPES